jgi:hypothetical protein
MYEMLSGREAFGSVSKAGLRGQNPDCESDGWRTYLPLWRGYRPMPGEEETGAVDSTSGNRACRIQAAADSGGGGRIPGASDSEAGEAAPAPVSSPADADLLCPMCGARDVHSSWPVEPLGSKLVRVRMTVNRCYRCYHGFLEVAGLYVRAVTEVRRSLEKTRSGKAAAISTQVPASGVSPLGGASAWPNGGLVSGPT